jgi:outer membrane protein with beta-barrel domain
MFKLLKFITLLICITHSISLRAADNMFIDVNALYTIPDAGGSDKFHTGKIVNANFNYYSLPWLALTSGFFYSEEIFDNTRTDIVGTYQASIKTQGVTLGLRPEYAFSERNKVFVRVGILFYQTTLTVNEFFAPGLPTGSPTNKTDGNGYLFSLGWAHNFTNQVSFQLELYNQTQTDLFDGKTSADNVFNINYTGFSLGLAYGF